MSLWHWLVHVTGSDYTGRYGQLVPYSFWSGFGSRSLGAVFLLGLYHRFNCHQSGCWRLGKHHVDGTPWCSKHHQAARKAGNG